MIFLFLVRTVRKNEGEYYELLMNYSRKHLMLFPYHLADMVVRGLRITPFAYYCQMLEDIMLSERSYDALPNFTAADCMCPLIHSKDRLVQVCACSASDAINTLT
jgi:hypothetical protein